MVSEHAANYICATGLVPYLPGHLSEVLEAAAKVVSQLADGLAYKQVAAYQEFTGEGTKKAAAAYLPEGVTNAKAFSR